MGGGRRVGGCKNTRLPLNTSCGQPSRTTTYSQTIFAAIGCIVEDVFPFPLSWAGRGSVSLVRQGG